MVIRTMRCTIRPFVESDIDEFMIYRNDLEWMKYQGFKGKEKQDYINALLGDYSPQNGVQLAIAHNETGVVIGDIYIREEAPAYWIGYTICRSKARQGYAYESVSAVMDTLKKMGALCIKAGVEPQNSASIALLIKLGFRYVETKNDEQIFVFDLCTA